MDASQAGLSVQAKAVERTAIGGLQGTLADEVSALDEALSRFGAHLEPVLALDQPTPGSDLELAAPSAYSAVGKEISVAIARIRSLRSRVETLDRLLEI